ncbi:PREDICTED: transcription factor Pur-alpha 1-like [Brassica oleracea var. oleracea]|uniref:transcription factor Pur-alpha 1-like n=1 Tax=Brassica oleracea var. oleracea TaxID=109376 RepID=UPI0006A6AA72|nr:PREDICTED: transcription factor Pur-alpha 1-like [Brassica oleracea var. oleracea]
MDHVRWAAFRNTLAEILEASGLMVPNQKPSDAEEHLVGLSDDVGVGFIPDHGNQPSSSTVDRATDSTCQDETGVSKVIRADQKRFFFDLGNNNRGHFLKISEVLDELELVSKTLQVERKLFYLDLKENPRGKYLKISEKTSGSRSIIIVPSSGISWFLDLFNYYVRRAREQRVAA